MAERGQWVTGLSLGMAGRRPLTPAEQRQLIRIARRLPARDGALITAQLMSGFRIAEVLSLTVGSVMRNGELSTKIGIAPRNMKGGYGRTRWVPVVPELRRALSRHLNCMRTRWELTPDLPLFLSRQVTADGNARSITTEMARLIMHHAFSRAGIENDGRLGTHSLRKAWARNTYEACGKDICLLRAALNHSDVSISQRYLEVNAEELEAAMRAVDFTRGPRRRSKHLNVVPIMPESTIAMAG